jgi:hemolysin III
MIEVQGSIHVKPKLRGVSHEFAALVALACCAVLFRAAPSPRAMLAAGAYGVSLVALFGVSALYHRPTWAAGPRRWLRRLDHAAIFLLIAGTYTPICLLIGGRPGSVVLAVVWVGASLGILQCLLWVDAPRALVASIYVALGWVAVSVLPELRTTVGGRGLALLLAGGLAYSAGAAVYAARWPDPAPSVFGYHEIFHTLVIAAAACHFAVVLPVVRALR